jgi:hypothetical protein
LVVEELYRAVIWVVMGAGCCLMAPWPSDIGLTSKVSGRWPAECGMPTAAKLTNAEITQARNLGVDSRFTAGHGQAAIVAEASEETRFECAGLLSGKAALFVRTPAPDKQIFNAPVIENPGSN